MKRDKTERSPGLGKTGHQGQKAGDIMIWAAFARIRTKSCVSQEHDWQCEHAGEEQSWVFLRDTGGTMATGYWLLTVSI